MSTPEIPAVPTPIPNPFVGPRPMEKGDALFGRDAEIEQLYYLLSAERIVLLHSPSGAGKSSLVQAGLIPRLTAHFDHWGPVRVNLPLPPDAPPGVSRFTRSCILGFESELPERLRRPESDIASLTLAQYLRSRPPSLRRRNAPENTVLIFDQFEEILTADLLALEARTAFFTQLGLLLQEDPHLWALFILREDFLAPLDPYANLLPTHLKTRFRLDLFTRTAAAEAIQRSIESAARTIAPVALVTLVTDLAMMQVQQPDGTFISEPGPYVEPLHLQVACRNLWDRLPADRTLIQPEDLDSFGGVTQALSDFYATEVHKVAASAQRPNFTERNIRDWVGSRLITRGDIRTQVLREPNRSGGLDNDLIERLVHTHLIRAEQRAGATWYELSHDRLIRPIRASNTLWFDQNLSTLQKTAALWRDQSEAPGLLLTGPALLEAQAWAAANDGSLDPNERAFLSESTEKQRTLDREASSTRRLRLFVLYAFVSAALAIGLAISAYLENRKANLAASQSALASLSDTLQTSGGSVAALAYVARAIRLNPVSPEARVWVADLLLRHGWWLPQQSFGAAGDVVTAALTGDGRRVATLSKTGIIQLWDARTRAPIGPPLHFPAPGYQPGHQDIIFFSYDDHLLIVISNQTAQVWSADTFQTIAPPVHFDAEVLSSSMAFDGRLLAVATLQATAIVWETATGRKLHQFTRPDIVNDIEFSRDGKLMAAVSEDGTAVLWSARDFHQIGPVLVPPGKCGAVHSANFSPDGAHLVTSCYQEIDLWPTAGEPKPRRFILPATDINEVSFSPNQNNLFVTASSDGVARVWNLDLPDSPNITSNFAILPSANSLFGAYFAEDGKRIVTTSYDQSMRIWDAATYRPLGAPIPSNSDIQASSISNDGSVVLTSSQGQPAFTWTYDPPGHGGGELLAPPGELVSLSQNPALLLSLVGPQRLFQLSNSRGVLIGSPLVGNLASDYQMPSPDGSRILFAVRKLTDGVSRFTSMQLWDTATGKPVGPELPDADDVFFSPDSQLLALRFGDEESIKIFNARTAAPLPAGFSHKNLSATSFAPAGHTLVSGFFGGASIWDGLNGSLKAWSTAPGDGHQLTTRGMVNDAEFSPDGKHVALATQDRRAEVWNVNSGKLERTFKTPVEVIHVQFTLDNQNLITITGDYQVQAWNISTGMALSSPAHLCIAPCVPSSAVQVRLSPYATMAVFTDSNRAQLWNTLTGRPIGEPIILTESIVGAIFTPDSRELLLVSDPGSLAVHRYQLDLDSRSAKDAKTLSTLAEAVGGTRIDPSTGTLQTQPGEDRLKAIRKLRQDFHIPPDAPLLNFFAALFSHPG